MKTIYFILFLLSAALALGGGLPVVDAAAIAAGKLAAERDLLEQILQEENQQKQILKLVEQVRQMDAYLARVGNPAEVNRLIGADVLLKDLESSSVADLTSAASLDENRIFRPFGRNVEPSITQQIIIDGQVEGTRSGDVYAPEAAERESVEMFKSVRESALNRRKQVQEALAMTTRQLQAATTLSEVEKLKAVMVGLQTTLDGIDRELNFAWMSAEAQALENRTEREVQRKAEIERERVALRVGTRKDAELYQLFAKPVNFSE